MQGNHSTVLTIAQASKYYKTNYIISGKHYSHTIAYTTNTSLHYKRCKLHKKKQFTEYTQNYVHATVEIRLSASKEASAARNQSAIYENHLINRLVNLLLNKQSVRITGKLRIRTNNMKNMKQETENVQQTVPQIIRQETCNMPNQPVQ